MSKNNIKLIMENWNKFVNEAPKGPMETKKEILQKIKDEIADVEKEIKSLKAPAAAIPTPIGMASRKIKLKRLQAKLKKLKEKLKKKEADLAGPGGNADQQNKKIKEQVTDEELKNAKPQCKKEGNYVVCTLKHKGKTVKGKGKIRAGNLGMAKTTAETRARQALARAIAQERTPEM